jgi:hypothetical protein
VFRYHTEKTWMRKHHGEEADCNLRVGKIVRELVLVGDGTEGLKTDSSAHFGVGWGCSANYQRLLAGAESLRLSCHKANLLLNSWLEKRQATCVLDSPNGRGCHREVPSRF